MSEWFWRIVLSSSFLCKSVLGINRAVQRPLGGQVLKVKGARNTAFNRAVLFADVCIEMDASVLIQQQGLKKLKYHFKFKC